MTAFARVLATALALSIGWTARAEYPDRPLRLVLPFAAGGAADAVARTLAPALAKRLGQPVVVENRNGAEGIIAGQAVASAQADGYTILYAVSATAALPVVGHPSYQSSDFAPVTTIGTYDFGMFISNTVPAESVRDFVAYARAHPGRINFATFNVGEHFAAAQFMRAAGIEMTRVPYRSIAQVLPDMVAGQVQVNFGPLSNGIALAKGGRVRMLATLGPHRSPLTPEVPTMSESGLPEVTFESVQMLLVPAKTPAGIIEKLSREVNAVIAQPEVRAQLEKLTLRVKGSSPDALRQALAAADASWARFARDYHLGGE